MVAILDDRLEPSTIIGGSLNLNPRAHAAMVACRDPRLLHVEGARIVLLSADGVGTTEGPAKAAGEAGHGIRVIFDVPAKDAHHARGKLRATLEEVNLGWRRTGTFATT